MVAIMNKELSHVFSLHKGQLEVFRCTARNRVAVMGRRWGKSRLLICEIAMDALGYKGLLDKMSPPVVLAALPTLKQAKKILFGPLVSMFSETDLKDTVEDINRSDMTIRLKGKPPIVVAGANDGDGDRLRGLRIYSLKCDEYADFKPGIRENILEPALADTPGSRALYTGTPKGFNNHLYEVFSYGTPGSPTARDDWQSFNMPSSMNPSKSLQKAIERARKTMVPRVFKQEYEASFVQFPGQVFYELSPEENRVAEAPLAFQRVILGIDFGDVNPGICVVGLAGGIWYFLEAWQPRGGNPVPQPIFDQELLRIATRWRPDGCFCDPSRPSAILGIRSLGREHGQPGLIKAVAGYNPIAEGCGQVHSLIYQRRLLWPMGTPGYQGPPQAALDGYMSPSMAFDLITSYHKASDSFGTVLDRIADGQDDHASVDALRYALATKSG